MEVHLIKSAGILRPATDEATEQLQKIKNGALCIAKIVQPRNALFHRKLFALLNVGFEYWEPEIAPTKSGVMPEKNRDKFREDVTIMAGYHDVVVNLKGEARYMAKSISFGSMDDTEFHDLYKAVFGVIWRLVLSKVPNMTEEQAHNIINELSDFV